MMTSTNPFTKAKIYKKFSNINKCYICIGFPVKNCFY